MRLQQRMRASLSATLLATMLALTSCGLPGTSPASSLAQNGGYPTLHRLIWGFSYVDSMQWSPDGHWIALLAGSDYATSHLEVVSPDGRKRYDLSSWECGDSTTFSFAWLANGALACVTNTDRITTGTFPFSAHAITRMAPPLHPYDTGVTTSSDPGILIVSSLTSASDPVNVTISQLYEVTLQGDVTSVPLTSRPTDVRFPAWQPHGRSVTYLVQESQSTGGFDLYRSTVTDSTKGLSLQEGALLAQRVDQNYTWSPSGHWLAVRQPGYSGGDHIYLINPDNPSQTVDVVLADLVGQQMTDPIWSPDGNTLIVSSVGVTDAYPYSLDIGGYLRSKGLQP